MPRKQSLKVVIHLCSEIPVLGGSFWGNIDRSSAQRILQSVELIQSQNLGEENCEGLRVVEAEEGALSGELVVGEGGH